MEEKNKEKNKEELDKLMKDLQAEQMRLHPEIYDKKKNGGD